MNNLTITAASRERRRLIYNHDAAEVGDDAVQKTLLGLSARERDLVTRAAGVFEEGLKGVGNGGAMDTVIVLADFLNAYHAKSK